MAGITWVAARHPRCWFHQLTKADAASLDAWYVDDMSSSYAFPTNNSELMLRNDGTVSYITAAGTPDFLLQTIDEQHQTLATFAALLKQQSVLVKQQSPVLMMLPATLIVDATRAAPPPQYHRRSC